MIISIAPMFRGPDDMNGHFASVQMGFVESAIRLDIRFIICDGERMWELKEPNRLVTTSSLDQPNLNIFDKLHKWIKELKYSEDITILVFEGSLSSVIEVAKFARTNPNVRIYINLFYPEAGLSIPGTYDHFVGEITDYQSTKRVKEAKAVLDQNLNIRVSCDTDARSLLARSLGIRVDATWYGRSPVGPLALQFAKTENRKLEPSERIKVFITVDIKRFTAGQFWWCIGVIRFVDSICRRKKTGFDWIFNFEPKEVSRTFRLLIRSLPKQRTIFVKSKVPLYQYAKRIHEADIIWLPLSSYYVSSSSGRVADAITLLKPVLVPSGTYGDFEFSKWIPNWPTYRSQYDCAQILLNLRRLLPLANQELRAQASMISDYYSNVNQLKRVVGLQKDTLDKSKIKKFNEADSFHSAINISIAGFTVALLRSLSPINYARLMKLINAGIRRRIFTKFGR